MCLSILLQIIYNINILQQQPQVPLCVLVYYMHFEIDIQL